MMAKPGALRADMPGLGEAIPMNSPRKPGRTGFGQPPFPGPCAEGRKSKVGRLASTRPVREGVIRCQLSAFRIVSAASDHLRPRSRPYRWRSQRAHLTPDTSTHGLQGRAHPVFNLRPSPFALRLSTFDLRPSTFALRLSTFDLRPSTFDLRLSTFDFRLSTFDL